MNYYDACLQVCHFLSFVRNIVPYLKKYAKNPVTGEVCTEKYNLQLNIYLKATLLAIATSFSPWDAL